MVNKPILLTFQRRYTSSAIGDILLGQSKYIFSEKGVLATTRYTLYNIGNNHLENLLDFVQILQEELVPMQAGDVPVTYADTSALERDFGFKPSTPLRIDERQG